MMCLYEFTCAAQKAKIVLTEAGGCLKSLSVPPLQVYEDCFSRYVFQAVIFILQSSWQKFYCFFFIKIAMTSIGEFLQGLISFKQKVLQ